ncbi:sugar phosphate isomerase/epimerase family protein [Candidatus Poribacteria bacterium]
MKAGVSSYCFNQMLISDEITLMEVIEFVGSKTEADCVEPLSRYWEEDSDVNDQARAAREAVDRLGLQVSCYTLDSDFAVYDTAKYRQCIETSIARLETALILGTDTIRLDPRTSLSGRSRDKVDVDDIIERIARGMAEISDAAAEKGITVGVENHGSMLGRTAQTAKIVELVNRPNFGVNLDFTNFRAVYGEDHVEATRILADKVVHIHAKDFCISSEPKEEGEGWRQIPSGEYTRRSVGGEGDTQWKEVFSILKEAGYDGTISLEVSDPADIKGSVAKGVANIKRVIAEIGAG